jgi:hypothetical protein
MHLRHQGSRLSANTLTSPSPSRDFAHWRNPFWNPVSARRPNAGTLSLWPLQSRMQMKGITLAGRLKVSSISKSLLSLACTDDTDLFLTVCTFCGLTFYYRTGPTEG